jgi:hypothetical protein
MNASQDQGGQKPRRMGHPVQVAQNRRKKNAEARKSRREQPPEPIRIVGDARDRVVKNILREQDAQFQQKFGNQDPDEKSLLGKVTVYLIDGMEASMEEQKRRQEESFDKFVAFCKQLFNRKR